ncbi:MAG TPA: sulfite exporter TauE/SafE family protein [Solirubrobacteraceae bacterium]|nr:sulfite exporter TauE/SafE family protein [Solirubrobacteraceae bacterium]
MELVLFALWCFAVAAAGGLVGLVLGNLRLPATLLAASSAAGGAGANLAISAIAAATAAAVHVRAGRVNWRLFAWMAPPSILGAVAGGLLGGAMPDRALLLFISAVLLYSARELFTWRPRRPPAADGAPERGEDLDLRAAVLTGAGIGLLGGIVGLILGSLRMPALLRWVRETPQRAVGTNVALGLVVGVAGALAHIPSAPPDLDLVLAGGAASIPGALVGSRLTGRLSEIQLVRAIGVVLVLSAAGCAAQAIT